ncbi:MAG: hypothetical protein PVF82_16060 [Gammaproteobacteria bacterium]|jgi:hypothetical protein
MRWAEVRSPTQIVFRNFLREMLTAIAEQLVIVIWFGSKIELLNNNMRFIFSALHEKIIWIACNEVQGKQVDAAEKVLAFFLEAQHNT